MRRTWLSVPAALTQFPTVEMPCVFCGTTPALVVTLTPGIVCVQCLHCSAQGPAAQTDALAVQAWQSRGQLPWQICPICFQSFVPRRANQRYDRPRCAQLAWTKMRQMRRLVQKVTAA